MNNVANENYIPQKLKEYVQWGHFDKISKIIASKQFFPMWISGLAGNGKTQMVQQACAHHGREFIRVNFTKETDENDLIGGFRLVNGNTEFQEGPVVRAMRLGAILLLDEIDTGDCNKVLCLQSILEGNGVLIKAIDKKVMPAPGFNIFATSNTKGRGSDDGRFQGTNIMNAAFLDRFAGMVYQPYPDKEVETTIIKNYFVSEVWKDKKSTNDISAEEQEQSKSFIAKLANWGQHIRVLYDDGGIDEVITTRSLISVVKAFSIFKDEELAVEMCCERYEVAIKDAFIDIYKKLSDDPDAIDPAPVPDDDDSAYHSYTPQYNTP